MKKAIGFLTPLLRRPLTRKEFLKLCLSGLALLPMLGRSRYAESSTPTGFNGRTKKRLRGAYDLVAIKGPDPYENTRRAIQELGGMELFVKKDDVVVIKPNIAWDRTPSQAATTEPLVVTALIDLAFRAGAKKVNVFDITCHDARRCYASSGIAEAAKARGANVYFPEDWNTIPADLGRESPMQGWPIVRDAVTCDVFINVPVLKHHRLTGLTLSMKNLMGVCTGNRGTIHQNIGPKLVDLTDFIRPELTVIDATRVLLRNGPTGGDLDDVVAKNTVLAGTDATLADIYAAGLVGVAPNTIPYLREAMARGSNMTELSQARLFTASL